MKWLLPSQPAERGFGIKMNQLSPVTAIYERIQAIQPGLTVEIGRPRAASGDGWVSGTDLRNASAGPFHDLLRRMGETLNEQDRRTIAASFALRYGWAGGIAIAPYLLHQCVPDINLENTAYRFGGQFSMYQRAAIYNPRGAMLAANNAAVHPSIRPISSSMELLQLLRESLISQATPVVNALCEWSHFSSRGLWGLIASSWGSQFINVVSRIDEQKNGLAYVKAFFAGNDTICEMQPRYYPVTYGAVTHVYQCAAACCRFYLRPNKQYCANCPLLPQQTRVERNLTWMKARLSESTREGA